MNWEQIAGQENLKKLLKDSVLNNRVSHAQLFLGKDGYGCLPLALAYAKEILKGENNSAAAKVEHLNHLDLHFSFPVYTEKSNSLSKRFFPQFREMVADNPYAALDDWSSCLESENKQLFISADEIEEQNQKFALKSYEGGSKILIIWRADKMNDSASNKLLKFLEEPPEKTIIILTAENSNDILPTILSRTQTVEVPRINDEDLFVFLRAKCDLDDDQLKAIIFESQGNANEAQKLLNNNGETSEFEDLFVQWVRNASQVKKNPVFLREIIIWARNIATWNREKQKNFIEFCTEIFRLALLENYGIQNLVYKKISVNSFKWDKFSKFIHGANIENILKELSDADYHLQRNGNTKIIWTDLGIKLSRYIHKSAS